MVANVSPLNVMQNNSATHQSSNASTGNGGPSFASMLNSEMTSHAATPPAQPVAPTQPANAANNGTPPAATNPPPAAAPAKASGGTPNSSTGSTGASGSASNGKKTGKTGQAATDAQSSAAQTAAAATAATAAALAAAASNPDLTTTADAAAAVAASSVSASSTAAANAASIAGTGASGAAANQFSALAGSVVANAASGQARDTSSKAALNLTQPAGTGKAPATAVITQNAVAATSPSLPGSFGKFSEQAPAELSATPNKNGNLEAVIPKSAPLPDSPVTPQTSSASALADVAAPVLAAPMQDLKSVGQDLSAQQLNAIAPVLTLPANQDVATPTDNIAPQVGSPAWDSAIGQKINWMVSAGQQTATLTLNPPNLGPMQVVLSVNNQHASATFISHQPEVRAALENAVPKLREMMEQSGIQLGQCNVNSQAQQQAFAQQQANKGSGGSSSAITAVGNDIGVMASQSSITTKSGMGLVDTFV